MIEYSLFIFIFYFSLFGEISQLGTPKKKCCCPQVGVLSSSNPRRYLWTRYPTKWFYPLRLIWTFSSSEITRGFSGGPDPPSSGSTHLFLCRPSQAPKLRAVLLVDRTHHKVGLYASPLIRTFSRSSCEEGASERASEGSRHTVETSTKKSLCKVGALSVCFFRNLSVGVLP